MQKFLFASAIAVCALSLFVYVLLEKFRWSLQHSPLAILIAGITLTLYLLISRSSRNTPSAKPLTQTALVSLALLLVFLPIQVGYALTDRGCFMLLKLPLLPALQLPHPYDYYVCHILLAGGPPHSRHEC
jgi:hypothetical protein